MTTNYVDDFDRFNTLASLCKFNDWNLYVGLDEHRCYLQVKFAAPCNRGGGKPTIHHGRKWLLSPHMTDSEVVSTVFKAVMTAVEHETREQFRYKGQSVFGPHFDVDWLASMCQIRTEDHRS